MTASTHRPEPTDVPADGPVDDPVVLVDAQDVEIGTRGKLAAHQAPGQLHRALSAFVLRNDDRIVLQRRAHSKYHFGGLWSNSCCTHPRPGETVAAAGERRIVEELGLYCRFEHVGTFTYRAIDPGSKLVEHELDHVLLGRSSADPTPDPSEVSDTAEMSVDELRTALGRFPDRYTPWLAPALEVLAAALGSHRTPPVPDLDEVPRP